MNKKWTAEGAIRPIDQEIFLEIVTNFYHGVKNYSINLRSCRLKTIAMNYHNSPEFTNIYFHITELVRTSQDFLAKCKPFKSKSYNQPTRTATLYIGWENKG